MQASAFAEQYFAVYLMFIHPRNRKRATHGWRGRCLRTSRSPGQENRHTYVQRKSTESTSCILSKEVEYLKAIESFDIPRFQKVIDYEMHGNPLICAPFISVEWADGEPLRWTDTSPADLSHRQKIIHAIAEATLDLLQIQRPGKLTTTSVCKLVS